MTATGGVAQDARKPSSSRLALIDDEAVLATALSRLLQRDGFTVVVEACDGHAGIAAVREQRPDLVITDLQMPGMDGIELATTLRAQGWSLPIVILTAFPDEQTMQRARAAGIAAVVPKGDGLVEVPHVLREVLAEHC